MVPGQVLVFRAEPEGANGIIFGYYLEAVVMLAPFCKKPCTLNLKGVTNDIYDPTVREKNVMLQDHFIVCCCNYCCCHCLA